MLLATVIACDGSSSHVGFLAADAGDAGDAAAATNDATAPPAGGARGPTPVPGCFDDTQCAVSDGGFEEIFVAPDGVELREALGSEVLAFDSVAKQFLLYSLYVPPPRTDPLVAPVVSGPTPMAPTIERMTLLPAGNITWSAGGAALTIAGDGTSPIPDDVAATSADGFCVAGRGIKCLSHGHWDWLAPPELFAAPIERFVELRELGEAPVMLIVLENGGASLLRNGVLEPFDLGTKERLASLSTNDVDSPAEWAAVTTDGKLVRGSLLGGQSCATTVRFGRTAHRTGLLVQQENRMLRPAYNGGCYAYTTPPEIRAHGAVGCGLDLALFVMDSRRVYAQKLTCSYD